MSTATTSYEYSIKGGYSIVQQPSLINQSSQENLKYHGSEGEAVPKWSTEAQASPDMANPGEEIQRQWSKEHLSADLSQREQSHSTWQSQASATTSNDMLSLFGGAQPNSSQSFESETKLSTLSNEMFQGQSKKGRANEIRHENPFNKSRSCETTDAAKQTALFQRQHTTPARPRPPRPPPPRSRSGSQSLLNTDLSKQSSVVEEFIAHSSLPKSPSPSTNLTNQSPTRFGGTAPTALGTNSEDVADESSSSHEISYLTRLQCQQIVSAVDDMKTRISSSHLHTHERQCETETTDRLEIMPPTPIDVRHFTHKSFD